MQDRFRRHLEINRLGYNLKIAIPSFVVYQLENSFVQRHPEEVLNSMIPWNNKIMKTHGRSIRTKIFEAYQQSFARACIIVRVEKKKQELAQAKLLNDYMNGLPEDKWGHT